MRKVLIVDDEATIAWGLARLAREEGHEAFTAASAEEAVALLERTPCDLVFLDIRLPGADGLTVMPVVAASRSSPKIVVMTAFGDLTTAVRAYGHGAFDYLVKPFDLEDASRLIRRAFNRPEKVIPKVEPEAAGVRSLVGKSHAMQEVFKRIALVAPTESTVVITGESGTGKELIAREIHRHSLRSAGPLVPIHIAALSPQSIESELFGHRQGALRSGDVSRPGLLEVASGGTAFLDEIGAIPLEIQVKLLRVIEEQEVVAVGATESQPVRCRILAATNRDLRDEMRAGRFREDLYFRLAMFELALPPLRDRGDDIHLLAHEFLRECAGNQVYFSRDALRRLGEYHWPGNVRQLRNAVQHAALLARGGEVDVRHLPADIQGGVPTETPGELGADSLSSAVRDWTWRQLRQGETPANLYEDFLHAVEPPMLEAVLERTRQNRAAAAELLGIHRATLRKKLAEAE